MSEKEKKDDPKSLRGLGRFELALAVSIGILLIFGIAVLVPLYYINWAGITTTGTIDVGLMFQQTYSTFIGIVIAIIAFLGITRGRAPTPGASGGQ